MYIPCIIETESCKTFESWNMLKHMKHHTVFERYLGFGFGEASQFHDVSWIWRRCLSVAKATDFSREVDTFDPQIIDFIDSIDFIDFRFTSSSFQVLFLTLDPSNPVKAFKTVPTIVISFTSPSHLLSIQDTARYFKNIGDSSFLASHGGWGTQCSIVVIVMPSWCAVVTWHRHRTAAWSKSG